MKNIFKSLSTEKIGYVLWGLVVLLPIVLSIFKSDIHGDAAYFILMGERIAEGYIPYVTIDVPYTPLWFYLEAIFKIVFQIPNGLYWPYLLLFYVIEVFTAFCLYRFLLCVNTKQKVAYFGSGLFLLIVHWLDGNHVLLEIPFLFFGILSCWLTLEWKEKNSIVYLLVGTLSACSFLTKQYGAGFFILVLYILLFIAKKGYKELIMYMLGYVLPIILCILLFGDKFITAVIFNGYGTETASLAGYDISFANKIYQMSNGLKYYFIYVCPLSFLPILFICSIVKQRGFKILLFAYCGMLGFALQFYFNIGNHYMIPLVPFGIIAITEFLSLDNKKAWMNFIKCVLITIIITIPLYKTYKNRVIKMYFNNPDRDKKEILAQELKSYIDGEETLYIVHGGLFSLYFLSDIKPPNIDDVGYSFGPLGINQVECLKQIQDADYVLRFSNDYPYDYFFTDSIKSYLESYPVVQQFNDSSILLHKIY